MASSRQLPVDYNVSSYGGVTRDYTVLATWEADTDIDLVSATKGEVLEVYNDAVYDDSCELLGATASADYYRLVKAASGEGHDGTPGTGARFMNVSNTTSNQVFRVYESYFAVEDLEVSNNRTRVCIYFATGDYRRMVGCIGTALDAGSDAWVRSDSANDVLINSLCFEAAAAGFEAQADTKFYNCTAVDCAGAGFQRVDSGTPVAKNCASVDNGTNTFGNFTETTCYSGTATAFADQASDDYHLDSSDATCRGNGTDLSADATYPFDDDIDGDTRSAWDIGADEYVATTTATPTTIAPTTTAPTTVIPTTLTPTTILPTTISPTTIAPTTIAPTTAVPTTIVPTTIAPTTLTPTTITPTTIGSTTLAPTTAPPATTRRRGKRNFGHSLRSNWRE